jgi:nicotinate-nucleotide adenylyltransferase
VRTGILGGTFDPPHLGHLVLADQCADQLALDDVLFLPAYRPPHKLEAPVSDFEIRYEMLRSALAGVARCRPLTLERDQGGISYTVRTLETLRATRSADELWLLIGADSLDDMIHWRDPERIAALARIAVYRRRGAATAVEASFASSVTWVEGPMIDISSRGIRQLVHAGRSIRHLVPEGVREIITRERLYLDRPL